jgi:hypothetical protein
MILEYNATMPPPATEKIAAMGRDIESRQGIGW